MAEYTAYFKTVVPVLEDIYRTEIDVDSDGLVPLFENQKVPLNIKFSIQGKLRKNTVIHFDLYDGTVEDENLISHLDYKNLGQASPDDHSLVPAPMDPGEYKTTIHIRSVNKDMSRLILTAKIGDDGEMQTKTYDLEPVYDSGSKELDYLDVPGSILNIWVGGYVTAGDKGPGAFDAASFVDHSTGGLHTYIATTSGIVYIDQHNNYSQMNGSANKPFIAIGGESEDDLYAVCLQNGDFQDYDAFSIYHCNDKTWEMVEGSLLQRGVSSKGADWPLLMTGDNIWTEDKHWNGEEWLENTYEFSTFWKADNDQAFAGGQDGIYRYDNGQWSKILEYGESKDIISGVNLQGSKRLLVGHFGVGHYGHRGDVIFGNGINLSSLTVIDIEDGTISETDVDISIFNRDYNNGISGAALDHHGNVLLMVPETIGCNEIIPENMYSGTMIYKLTENGWVYQHTPAMDAPLDVERQLEENYTERVRPNAVFFAKSTVPGVTIYMGCAGTIYAEYDETTITFNSNGGDAVAPITQKIGSQVRQPSSPGKEGCSFAGWYTSPNDPNSLYAFGTMPAKDITLYARWVEQGSQEEQEYLQAFRERELEVLDESFARLKRSTYSDANWALIEEIYERGKRDINAAETERAILDALNAAVEDMNAVEHLTVSDIKVCLTMELFTLNEGYIIRPTIVSARQYEQVSVLITEQLKKTFPSISQPWRMTGSVKNSFYLSYAYSEQEGWVGEFDHGLESGWMYCVNSYFPSVGASSWTVEDGDVIRWQYTVEGLGLDLGTSEEWATPDGQPASVANKDALTWLVAEVNGKIDSNAEYLTKYELQDEYDTAMTALTTMYSTQAAVNDAYDTLNAAFLEAKKKENEEQGQGGGGTLPDTDDVQELKAALSELIASAKEVSNEEGKYTEESFALMQEKIAAAEAVAADESAVADTVRTAFTDLSEAWKGLKISPEYEEKINKLKADIAAAVKDAEAISNADGKYTAERYKVLIDAINTARLIIADDNATTAQLEFALDAVAKAKAGLVEAPAPDEPPTPDEPSEPEVKPKKKAVVVNVKTVSAAEVNKST